MVGVLSKIVPKDSASKERLQKLQSWKAEMLEELDLENEEFSEIRSHAAMRCLIGEVSLARSASESYVKTLLPRCAEVAKSRSSSKAAAIKVLRLSDSDQDTGTKTQASLFGSSSVPLSHFRGGTEQSLGDPMFLRPPSHESMPLLAFRPRRGTGPETKPKAFLGLELQRANLGRGKP
eukprot:g566.t1